MSHRLSSWREKEREEERSEKKKEREKREGKKMEEIPVSWRKAAVAVASSSFSRHPTFLVEIRIKRRTSRDAEE